MEYVVLEGHQKLKDIRVHASVGTSWQAQYALDLAKMLSGAWPTGENDAAGFAVHRMAAPEEVAAKAFAVTELMVAGCAARGWSIDMPRLADIVDEGSPVGFASGANGGRHGEAGKGGEALPGSGHAAAADRRR